MVLALADKWIWDSWYVRDGDVWHAFFLQADKSLKDPELRHWNVSYGHATSADLINWTHLGTCFEPAATGSWDDFTTWTGSVIRGHDDQWHLFYTGTSRADDGLKQRIGHAVSNDLHQWRRVGDGLCLDLSGDHYEEYAPERWHDRAMRDPWVMRDPSGDGWLMFFTARATGPEEPNAAGAIGFATSPDLNNWTLQAPVFVGGFGQLEVPQVIKAGQRWVCLFCTSHTFWSAETLAGPLQPPVDGTHYLVADDPRGPWQVAAGAYLDGSLPCRRYAGRIVETEDGLRFMGFAYHAADGEFVGHVMDPEPIEIGRDGQLGLTRSGRSAA